MLIQHPNPKPHRDFQRKRVYEAEHEFTETYPEIFNEHLDDDRLNLIVDYINRISAFKRVQRQYGRELNQKDFFIERCRAWQCSADDEVIFIGDDFALNEPTLLHELAHLIQFRRHPYGTYAHHDETFLTIYLDLVSIVLGKSEAVRFERILVKRGVKYKR
jgi:hypothetical protein